MYERMVVAIDHSAATERVLAAARDLARLSQGRVWVVHVREHQAAGRGGVMPGETIDEAHQAADAAVAELTEAGVKAQADIRYAFMGYAAREIADSASAHDAGGHRHGLTGPGRPGGHAAGAAPRTRSFTWPAGRCWRSAE